MSWRSEVPALLRNGAPVRRGAENLNKLNSREGAARRLQANGGRQRTRGSSRSITPGPMKANHAQRSFPARRSKVQSKVRTSSGLHPLPRRRAPNQLSAIKQRYLRMVAQRALSQRATVRTPLRPGAPRTTSTVHAAAVNGTVATGARRSRGSSRLPRARVSTLSCHICRRFLSQTFLCTNP